ncbi:MAG: hypothetical protein GY761_02740 [Hyphomicrobiales bacterium]|nr:hypothetical protein [Hyphomicrobiales bacterium]
MEAKIIMLMYRSKQIAEHVSLDIESNAVYIHCKSGALEEAGFLVYGILVR